LIYKGNNQYSGLTLLNRFEQKVELIPFSTCHWWVAALDTYGYGQILIDGTAQRTHRVCYQLYRGPIPNELQVLHTCDNRSCVNPDHLFLGTNQDNVDDKVKKGRQSAMKGTKNPRAILSEDDVRQIRASDNTQAELSLEYGVSQSSINNVVHRLSWKHVV